MGGDAWDAPGFAAVLRPPHFGSQARFGVGKQPDRDAADSDCAVERHRPELAQNHRGRLQADAVALSIVSW